MKHFMASIIIATTLAGTAQAGGWSAPILDVPPPMPAPVAAPAAFNPWAPYVAAGLLLLILVAGHDGDSDHGGDHSSIPIPDPIDPTDPTVPTDPTDPQPAPVPLPGALGLMLAGLAGIGAIGRRRKSA